MFYIRVKDANGEESILDAYIKKEGDYRTIYIGDTHDGNRMDACVRILLKHKDSEAILEDLHTRQSCDINNNLQEGSGTYRLLMGALKFIIKKYTYIETVNLSDVAQKKGTRIYLTPKRLLLGKPGWYEEHFGARPTQKTRKIIEHVLQIINLTPEQMKLISKKTWGKSQDLEALSKEAIKLIHNDWIITRDTIYNYPVQIRVSSNISSFVGGGDSTFIKSVERIYRQYINSELKAIQLKYYQTPKLKESH